MALANSGGINVWLEFPGDTRNHFIEGMTTALLMAGWQLEERVKASLSHTYSSVSNGQVVQVGTLPYTFRNTITNSVAREVKIGATLGDSVSNLAAAIVTGAGRGSLYSTKTLTNPLMEATASGTTITFKFFMGGPVGNGTPTSYGPLVNGGYKVVALSPQYQVSNPSQQLSVKAHIYDRQASDSFGSKLASVQLYSASDPTVLAGEKLIKTVSGRRFQVVANRCQFFTLVPGTVNDNFGSVVTGGIPWVPEPSLCGGEVPAAPVDEAFWSNSDYNGSLTMRKLIAGFQTSAFGFYTNADTVFNGTVVSGAVGEPGNFRQVSMTPPTDYVNALASGEQITSEPIFVDERPMKMEPFVGWGPIDNTHNPQIFGQLYDAWTLGKPAAMDQVKRFDGDYWLGFTNNALFGGLWLKVPGLTPLQFEDIQASYAH
jgi:hypothetical protein